MGWYRRHSRTLPWRRDPTPYRVWISEIMLQQTQVATAISYYVRFLERFPDLDALAKASEQEVLKLWSGLGYYRRAKNLHRAAREILQRHDGVFPADFKTILALPGIGRYTAGAICSLAFNQTQPVVDGNIRRVIARFNGIVSGAPETYFWRQMGAWVPEGKASTFNQAMMELGATVCTPSQPRCPRCPVKKFCRAFAKNLQNSLPAPRRVKPSQDIRMIILVLRKKGHILATGQKPDFIPGQWGLPSAVLAENASAEEAAEALVRRFPGAKARPSCISSITHAIGRRRIAACIFTAEAASSIRKPGDRTRWIERSRIGDTFTSSIFRKALASTGNTEDTEEDTESTEKTEKTERTGAIAVL